MRMKVLRTHILHLSNNALTNIHNLLKIERESRVDELMRHGLKYMWFFRKKVSRDDAIEYVLFNPSDIEKELHIKHKYFREINDIAKHSRLLHMSITKKMYEELEQFDYDNECDPNNYY